MSPTGRPAQSSRFPRAFSATTLGWTAAIGLTLVKLWLVAAQPVTAAANAANDDMLFVRLADSIFHGHWLGHYDQLTLSKGCGYSIFIAAVRSVHLPLPVAQQLLYAFAAGAFALAVAPALRWRVLAAGIFALVLFNPMTFEAPVMARVLRQHLATPAGLLVFAGFAGVALHQRGGYYVRLAWSAIAGIGLAASWLTREEAGLLFPGACLLAATGIIAHRRTWRRPATWILLGLPWGIFAAADLGVAGLNRIYYGAWVTVESRAPAFADAYGALLRVRPREWQPYVPVPREVRERLYAVSPAFAQLRDYFEGDAGRNWAALGTSLTGKAASEREIAGGWFMWALREGAQQSGKFRNAREALAYYRRLADEVNAAADDGRLDALPQRSGFLPVWHEDYRRPWLDAVKNGASFLIHFKQFYARPAASTGDPAGLALFREMTLAKLAPEDGTPPPYTPLDRARLRFLETLGGAYQILGPWLLGLGVAGTLVLAFAPGARRARPLLVLQGALVLTVAGTLAATAFIHISSFPTLITGYYHSSYPLMLAFIGIGICGLAHLVRPPDSAGPSAGAS